MYTASPAVYPATVRHVPKGTLAPLIPRIPEKGVGRPALELSPKHAGVRRRVASKGKEDRIKSTKAVVLRFQPLKLFG